MSKLFLSRLFLNPRSREVHRDLSDCQAFHQRLLSAYPAAASGSPRAEFGLLYRVDFDGTTGSPVVLAQSGTRPDWYSLPFDYLHPQSCSANPDLKSIEGVYDGIREGTMLRFRLRANPTRRENATRKRIELSREEDQIAWLHRKGTAGGFELAGVRIQRGDVLGAKQTGRRAAVDCPRLTFGTVVFDGLLEVTDTTAFLGALRAGIGSGKAYGFGLLSVAPAGG